MFISFQEFSTRYGVSECHISGLKKKLPEKVFKIDPHTRKLSIDEKFFLRRLEFKRKVINYIHDMYFLVTKVWSEAQMSRSIGVSQTTLNSFVWGISQTTILNYKIADCIWKMYRWFWKMELRIKKRYGITFKIEEILDNESRM